MRLKLLLLGFYVAVSLITRGAFIGVEILDQDETAHIVGSWQLMDGNILYADFVDNKPPLVYVYYAIAQLIFGHALPAVRLFTALFTIPLTAFGLSTFFEHSKKGIWAALLFLIYSAAFLAHDMHAINTEILMILPATWALVLISSSEKATVIHRLLLSGFLMGIAALLKYPVATWLGAIALAVVISGRSKMRRSFMSVTLILISFSLTLFAAFRILNAGGAGDDFLYWTWTNNLIYSANPISLREAIGRAAAGILPFLLITAPLWWYAGKGRSLGDSGYQSVLLYSLLLFSIPPVFLGYRFFPHYFIQLYVPLCLCAAPYVESLTIRNRRNFLFYSVAVLFCFTLANLYLYYSESSVYREKDPTYQTVSSRLERDSCFQGATMFVWGYAPAFYYYARLEPASRFCVLSQSGLTPYVSGNLEDLDASETSRRSFDPWDVLMEDLEKSCGTYIIDTAPAGIYRWDRYPVADFPRLQSYLHEHYTKLDVVEDVVIYKRKGCEKVFGKPNTQKNGG